VLYLVDRESREACGIRARAIHATTGGKLGQTALGVEVMITALTAGWGATAEYLDKPDERSVGGAIH
jgi:hypothetical protein